ncbi:hypothetical protein [Gilvimarinus polysaccharolyticus]|uniref:hypothetical protein n=1 Tax=Gilvimarinus polysaccharolyticus TaxID=863921 RepID=UPI0006734E6A|nr:hypothetical protein [Gilvimarinus polysaccharolyticus]
MNWLERYTFAVKSHLPPSVRNDVADELLSDLQDECDYREESLGRPLTDDEVKTLLRERGHPMLVAADFQPRPTLVSESLFPVYLQLLQWMVIAIAVLQVCFAGVELIGQGDVRFWQALPQTLWSILHQSLYGFAWLTLIFYLLGESVSRTDLFKRWKPDSLPNVVTQGEYISRTGSAFELVVTVYFTAWLNHVIPQSLGEQPIALIFSEQWATLLPWINTVLIVGMLISVTKLLSPYWTRRKILTELALSVATLIIMATIYRWDSPLAIMIGSGDSVKQFDIPANWITWGIAGYLVVAVIDSIVKIKRYRAL